MILAILLAAATPAPIAREAVGDWASCVFQAATTLATGPEPADILADVAMSVCRPKERLAEQASIARWVTERIPESVARSSWAEFARDMRYTLRQDAMAAVLKARLHRP